MVTIIKTKNQELKFLKLINLQINKKIFKSILTRQTLIKIENLLF